MNEDKKPSFVLSSALTVAGLVVSLFGNVVQYESLQQKKVELKQAQEKIDATNQTEERRQAAEEQRQASVTELMSSYQRRMNEIQVEMKAAEDDNRRAQVGMSLGKPEDQQYANGLLQDSIARHDRLIEEQKQLQEKIDALQLSSSK